jgi:hypothetical protein
MINKTIRIIKRGLIPGFLLISLSMRSFSQDTVKTYIVYDVFKAFVNEHSITLGHGIGTHHLVTFSLGYVYDNRNLRESFAGLSPNQDEFPVMVYTGPTVRAAYEFRFSSLYLGIDIFAKHLRYNHHVFKDEDRKDHMILYERSEKSNFLGGHVNLGFLLTIPKTPVLINPSVSLGGAMKYRNYTTAITLGPGEYGGHLPQEGSVSVRQDVISVMMNINIGIRIGK